MGDIVKEQDDYTLISSKHDTNYTFATKAQRLQEIWVEENGTTTKYYFEPTENEKRVTRELLERALESLLCSNPAGFDILQVCFYDLKEQQEYLAIAIKVFKEYWNKLYNLVIADDVFGRKTSIASEELYDFFKDFVNEQ